MEFQSSPVPKDGCNMGIEGLAREEVGFQSSPVPKDGCNESYEEAIRFRDTGFNPHPSRRTGATGSPRGPRRRMDAFQSSPVPKDGCNAQIGKGGSQVSGVSILTRPEGRVQPVAQAAAAAGRKVSILTRPEGRVQLGASG